MADVTSAFKILIEAHPDEAVAAFNAVDKAIDGTKEKTASWQENVTGANQALELMTHTGELVFSAIEKVGDAFIEAAKGAAELIMKGGEFGEQKGQLDSLAASYGTTGDTIIDIIKKVGDNTVAMGDAMRMASKIAVTGLSTDDLETSLTYAKKWSEATGQSFEEVAEKITSAMVKGRTGVLKEMGIIVATGSDVNTVVAEMEKNLGRFADTGINTADRMKSLNNSWDEFLLKIGKALNDTPELGKALTELADMAQEFVKGFDYNQITEFFSVGIKAAEAFAESFKGTFDEVLATLVEIFTGGSTNAKDFFKYLNDVLFGVAETVGAVVNAIITLVAEVIDPIGKAVDGIVQLVTTAAGNSAEIVSKVLDSVLASMQSVFGTLDELVAGSPNLAKLLGVDSSEFGGLSATIQSARDALAGLGKGFQDTLEGASGASESLFANIKTGMNDWKLDTTALASKHLEVNAAIDAITYDPVVKKATDAAPKIAEAFKTEFSKIDLGFDWSKLDFSVLKKGLSTSEFTQDIKNLTRGYQEMAETAAEAFKKKQAAELEAYQASVANDADQKRLVKEFKADQAAQLEQYKDMQTQSKQAFGDRITKEKEGFKDSAASAKSAYVDIGKDLEKSLDDAFKNVSQTSKSYLDLVAKDPFMSDWMKAREAKEVLDEQTEAQNRLLAAMEKMAANGGDTKLNVTIDGADNAIRDLVQKVIEELIIKARSEGVMVAGV